MHSNDPGPGSFVCRQAINDSIRFEVIEFFHIWSHRRIVAFWVVTLASHRDSWISNNSSTLKIFFSRLKKSRVTTRLFAENIPDKTLNRFLRNLDFLGRAWFSSSQMSSSEFKFLVYFVIFRWGFRGAFRSFWSLSEGFKYIYLIVNVFIEF